MRHTIRGGLVFLLIAVLVAGGLGWATAAALRLECEQREQLARTEHADRLRIALWRMDGRIAAFIAREEARAFNHYTAIFAPTPALDTRGRALVPGAVLEPSPLLNAPLPEWAMLHFQADCDRWESPQVVSSRLLTLLRQADGVSLTNVTSRRATLLGELRRRLPPVRTLEHARQLGRVATIRDRALLAARQIERENEPELAPSPYHASRAEGYREFVRRTGEGSRLTTTQKNYEVRIDPEAAQNNICRNGEEWLNLQRSQLQSRAEVPACTNAKFNVPPAEVMVSMSNMVGVWLPGDEPRLVLLRLVKLDSPSTEEKARHVREICQGVLLDARGLADLLAEEVQDLFPHARLTPVREAPGRDDPTILDELPRTMTTLPLRLDPGEPVAIEDPGWSALRLGLGLAWVAALVALAAVGLGGWTLLDLSQRRIRFVSAVTHELRTPLTTLRLYLDILLGGLMAEATSRKEYLETMSAETDRLTRLVNNVLDFSRLENQRPQLQMVALPAATLLQEVADAWRPRCTHAGKELLVVDEIAEGTLIRTDAALAGQVLSNLLDNACKYSRDAEDKRLWLRARREGDVIVLEVEDRGPGVPVAERGRIFRAFQRGRNAEQQGGVGLGLALAQRWTRMLGGRLSLHVSTECGACFRLELPLG